MLHTRWVAMFAALWLVGCNQELDEAGVARERTALAKLCAGRDTYGCRNRIVDLNLQVLRLADFNSPQVQQQIIGRYGDQGWALYRQTADTFVRETTAQLDAFRPSWWQRACCADDQPPSPWGRLMAFDVEEMASAEQDIQRRFTDSLARQPAR